MTKQLDSFFGAMADPTRRAVIEKLASGPATVSELHAPHDIALPTFMRHLKVLEDTGIVRSIKKGRVRTCHIEAGPLIEAQGWLAWQRQIWESRLDRLEDLAKKLEQFDD
ncbi:MAG: metalloregulator ArsR/SmtB family transcription factor [Pseudomonadota bacterium]